jgi:hypothetical protein
VKLALVVLGAIFAGGCDLLFDIHKIDPAVSDGSHVYLDAPPDMANCGMHDEDHDGVFDKCDVCPTLVDPDQADTDRDGVGDQCDPDPDKPNVIDQFYSFQNSVGVDNTGGSFPNDALHLGAGDNAVTAKPFTGPEVINVTIETLNTGASLDVIVNPGGANVTCELSTSCVGPPTCLFLSASTGEHAQIDLTYAASAISSLVLYRTGGDVRCSVNDLMVQDTAVLIGSAMPSGKLELMAIGGGITIDNAIVYNLQ